MASYYFLLFVLVAATTLSEAYAKKRLSADFYSTSCPELLPIVNKGVIRAIKNETRIGDSLLRLHFYDCFVNGCDASIMLDDTTSFIGEKTAADSNNSARGFNVIHDIKAMVEKSCFLAWEEGILPTTASRADANNIIPAPFLNLSPLRTKFSNKGLSVKDLVPLSRTKC
ncbi:peroxidase P7-like [Gastrolobium bilobum]|uniref:peroxidase P7-like n=1 Tax=Gastrolobium bilobum TaxID=150636 RepID=UPI002AB0F7D9|nr:peroxidase P7-like [Gastrolobium bilobum]